MRHHLAQVTCATIWRMSLASVGGATAEAPEGVGQVRVSKPGTGSGIDPLMACPGGDRRRDARLSVVRRRMPRGRCVWAASWVSGRLRSPRSPGRSNHEANRVADCSGPHRCHSLARSGNRSASPISVRRRRISSSRMTRARCSRASSRSILQCVRLGQSCRDGAHRVVRAADLSGHHLPEERLLVVEVRVDRLLRNPGPLWKSSPNSADRMSGSREDEARLCSVRRL
jgi:hypothetical protein